MLFYQGELQRKIGVKVSELGGNAVIGYGQACILNINIMIIMVYVNTTGTCIYEYFYCEGKIR